MCTRYIYSNNCECSPGSCTCEFKWERDEDVDKCRRCRKKFSTFIRRHHCRRCGQVVCRWCSKARVTMPPEQVVNRPGKKVVKNILQRVCSSCVPECSVCCEEYTLIQQISPVCGHDDLCPRCIKRHIETEMNNKEDVKVRCPKPHCTYELTYNDLKRLTSKELFDRYDNLLLRAEIRGISNLRWCKAPDCDFAQEHTTGDIMPIITCKACGQKSCFTHDVPWHDGLTCEEFTEQLRLKNQEENDANRAYFELHTKSCPRCKKPIEKNNGCDHMTCRCGYEFCWSCLSDYEKIRNRGNHYHAPTCKHYAAYDSDDEYDEE